MTIVGTVGLEPQNPDSVPPCQWLCDLGQVTLHLSASVFSSVKYV